MSAPNNNVRSCRTIIAELVLHTEPITQRLGELCGKALHSGWLTIILQLGVFITWIVLEQVRPNRPLDDQALKSALNQLYNYLATIIIGSFALALLLKQLVEAKFTRFTKREKALEASFELVLACGTWLYAILAICYRPH
ncbi:hypothetical protein MMC20_001961 [Loxospora ochrophaea]|nr:hypothetical protein [Loxospora ochrophaea]